MVPRMTSATQGDSSLWCLHVIGPDDVYPAPSKEAAEVAKLHLERYWGQKDGLGHPFDPEIKFEAIPWPWSSESHAEDVRLFYTLTGTYEGMRIEDVKP